MAEKKGGRGNLVNGGKTLLRETAYTSWELLKITIPVVILTKILEEFGLIDLLSGYLAPLMGILGLPGEIGLVWATAIITNLYGAMVIFATLAPDLHLNTAQVTVVCSAMLIAHSLPLELAITKRAGAPFTPIALLRLFCGFIYGYLVHRICTILGVWQEEATIIFTSESREETLLSWCISQVENFFMIVLIIFCIIIIMKVLRAIGVLGLLEKILEPVLPIFGMSKRAAPVTVVGMVMGISYGGALIIKETTSGRLTKKEIFFSLALMGLSHALIEDTLLMVALGGHWVGLLIGRVLFSLLVIFLLVRLMKKIGR